MAPQTLLYASCGIRSQIFGACLTRTSVRDKSISESLCFSYTTWFTSRLQRLHLLYPMNLIGSRYCRETLKMALCFRESIQRRGVISKVANRSSCSSTHMSNVLGSSKCLQFLVSIEWWGYQRKSYVSTMGYLFVQYTFSKWVSNTNRIVLNIKWSIWFSSIDLICTPTRKINDLCFYCAYIMNYQCKPW